jgi:hypothetical protein
MTFPNLMSIFAFIWYGLDLARCVVEMMTKKLWVRVVPNTTLLGQYKVRMRNDSGLCITQVSKPVAFTANRR